MRILLVILILLSVVFLANLAQAAPRKEIVTVDISRSILALHNTIVWLGTASLEGLWEMDDHLWVYPGVHLAVLNGKGDSPDVSLVGIDLFAKVWGGNFWSRYGIGFSLFLDQNEDYKTPWDFHIGIQTGYQLTERLGVILNMDHWSNARGGASNAGLERYWPERNDGGDMVGIGISYKY